jgi:hypothetical protein
MKQDSAFFQYVLDKKVEGLIKQRDALAAELKSLMSKLTPQTNGADEQCFIIGMRNQVSFQQMVRISELLDSINTNPRFCEITRNGEITYNSTPGKPINEEF